MNKTMKKFLGAATVFVYLATFGGPAYAGQTITLRDGEVRNFDTIHNQAGQELIIEIMNGLGDRCPSCKAILQGNSFTNDGLVSIFGTLGLAVQEFINTGHINAAGNLLISNLGINPQQFFSAMADLSRDPGRGVGSFKNTGTINVAGDWLAIVAGTFQNLGTISANGGVIGMSAGAQNVQFPLTADGVISMQVNDPITAEVFDKDGHKISDVWRNDGTIKGSVVVVNARGAEQAFDNIINHTGIIEAQTIGMREGKIVLDGGSEGVVRVDGVLDASGKKAGEKGGTVHILGDKIGLFEHTRIDVSGDIGGGEVLIGGDYQGKGSVPNANFVYMDKDAQIYADALTSGDGGKVILWSDNTTRAYGTISAKGGALSGNGGLVETSGKQSLDVNGINVNASATSGAAGKWLLDPYNVTIVSGTGSTNPGGYLGGIFAPNGNNATVGATTISNALSAGTNVEINTGAAGTQPGTIIISSLISMSSLGATVATLTLNAAGTILMTGGAGITAAGAAILNVVLNAGTSIQLSSGITTNGGSLKMTAANGAMSINLGSLSTAGQTASAHAGYNGGDVDIHAKMGVSITGTLNASGSNGSGSGSAQAGGNGGNVKILSDSGSISVADISSSGGNAGGIFGSANGGNGGNVQVLANGMPLSAAAVTTSGGNGGILGVGNGGNAGSIDLESSTSTVSLNGNLTTNGGAASLLGGTAGTGGNLTLVGKGITQVAGALTIGGATSLTADAMHDITLNKSGNDFKGTVSVVSGRDVTLVDTNALDLGTSNITDALSITAGGAITQSGVITAGTLAVTNTAAATDLSTQNNMLTHLGTINAAGQTFSLRNGRSLDQTGAITANNLLIKGSGPFNLTNGANNVNTLAANITGSLTYNDMNVLTVGTVNGTAGINTHGNDVMLNTGNTLTIGSGAGEGITATGATVTLNPAIGGVLEAAGSAIVAGQLLLKGAGTFDLAQNNNVDILAANVNGSVTYKDIDTLRIDTVGTTDGITTHNNKVDITSGGTLTLAKQINAGNANVKLRSAGAIRSANASTSVTPDIIGSAIDLIAALGGIGASGFAIKVRASTKIDADTTADNGDIYIKSIGDAPISVINAGSGNVDLYSTGNITDYNNTDNPDIIGGTINLTTEGADIGASTNYFDIEPSVLWNVTTNGGTPYIHCIGACPMGQEDVGTAIFFYKGNIKDGNDTVNGIWDPVTNTWSSGAVWNIRAGGAHLEATNGIGDASNWVEMELRNPHGITGPGLLEATGGTGGVYVSNGNTAGQGLKIGGIPGFLLGILAQSGILVMSGSPLIIAANVIDNSGLGITLSALGNSSADKLTVSANITENGVGAIVLTAGDDVLIHNNITSAASGDITVSSGHDILMDDGTIAKTGTGLIDFNAGRDISLSSVQTGSNASNAVLLTAAGGSSTSAAAGEVRSSGHANPNIVTGPNGTATIRAATGIGSNQTVDYQIQRAPNVLGPYTTVFTQSTNQGKGSFETPNVGSGYYRVLTTAKPGVQVVSVAGITVLPDGNIQVSWNRTNGVTTDRLETQVGQLSARTAAGDIQLHNTGDLTVTTANGVAGVTIDDRAAPGPADPGSSIFVTSSGSMTVNSAVTNFDAGNVDLYTVGGTAADFMKVNADVSSQGGNGNVRLVSGGDMTFAPGTTVSSSGNGSISGTGSVTIGAGYDTTGKLPSNPNAILLNAPTNGAANINMAPTSKVTTENGNILVDAMNNLNLSLLSTSKRAVVTTFSRNGSTLDADAATAVPQLNNIFAGTWNATAGGSIGISANPIETNAPIQNLSSGGDTMVDNTGNVLLNATSANGAIRFNSTGDILLGHSFAPNGHNTLNAGGSILSQGGPSTRVIGNDLIQLTAGGVIGTASNPIQIQLNNAGNLLLGAGGQIDSLSINVLGNFTRASVQFLNTPPGLALFNGIVAGGAEVPLFEAGTSGLYENPNPVSLPQYAQFDKRYSADFPALFNMARFSTSPMVDINTTGIDLLPIEGLGILPPVVPIPSPAVPPVPVPVPEGERPPLVVPLPGPATAPPSQPVRERIPALVYVAPGHGSNAVASSISGQQSGLTEPGSDQKKKQGSAVAAGMPRLLVPIPASANPLVQKPEAENNNPPFYVSPLSRTVREVRDQNGPISSPLGEEETVDLGKTSTPTVAQIDAAKHS